MVRYRCVGWGTTNSSGVATLDYDADGNPLLTSGYKGQGEGLVNFVASAENPSAINSSSDVSSTYEVIDALFFDEATDNTKASQYSFPSGVTPSYDETNGTTISYASTGNKYVSFKINNSTTWRDENTDYCIEFDVIFTTANEFFRMGGQNIKFSNLNGSSSGSGSVKFVTDGNTLTPYWNGTAITSQEKTMSSNAEAQLGLFGTTSMTFKNIKIYPI